MSPPSAEYDPSRIESEVSGFWRLRGLPRPGGISGPPDGAVLHAFEGSCVSQEGSGGIAFRAVAADVDARYLALAGRRAIGTLRFERTPGQDEPAEAALLRRLAVWTGGAGDAPWDGEERYRAVEAIVGRLARLGSIVSRDLPLRVCPTCTVPRAPERIIYEEEEGETYLVRFPVVLEGRTVSALVWVDTPWKLLGACAVLVHPDLPYVVARYRRKDSEELVLTSRSSLERFRAWIPSARLEVTAERPGNELAGLSYQYPLRHEFPMGGALTPPAGTIIAVGEVTDTGTGIVPLVPGHGSTDAQVAAAQGIPGWPLVSPRGQLDFTLVHKYAGLDLRTANEFIVRDLMEGNAVFAQLTVRHGVPHCLVCGSPLIWVPGRAWCLEPGRLPSEATALYERLLPGAPALGHVEVAPWPVSETTTSEAPSAVALLECSRCERLDSIDGPAACPCGGKMFPLRRRLTASVAAALSAWARFDPFRVGDSARLYLSERRRVPSAIHHLTAMAGIAVRPANVGITVLPTLPALDVTALVAQQGADAVRAALVRTETSERSPGHFAERCAQERRRLERLVSFASGLLSASDEGLRTSFLAPIAGSLGELEPEDRALLGRWERTRVLAIADYERGSPAAAHRRIFRFLDTDLADYRQWVRERLALPGTPATRRAALRSLLYLLRGVVVLLSPIAPYVADSIHRRLVADRTSVFETPLAAAESALLDDGGATAWDRWRSVIHSVDAYRRSIGLAPETVIDSIALVLATDDEGDPFRSDRAVLERLARVHRIEVGSPRDPWQGRRREVRPIESEIQRAYPAQASQIVHLLRRVPPRRANEPGIPSELSVVIQGLPRRVLPSMVEYVDTLPEGTVPIPWGLGELYVQRAGSRPEEALVPPPLSPDAFWLVRRLERRLRRIPLPAQGQRRRAVISAADPLAAELRGVAEPLARYLGLAEIGVVDPVEEAPPKDRISGRTHTGARWWVELPGAPAPGPRRKKRGRTGAGHRVPRVPAPPRSSGEVAETDFTDERIIAQEERVRSLNQELDSLLRTPLLGPAKLRGAQVAGFDTVEKLRTARLDDLAAVPGFRGGVAETVLEALGRPTRVRPPRSRRPSPLPAVPVGRARARRSRTVVSPARLRAAPPQPPPSGPSRQVPSQPEVEPSAGSLPESPPLAGVALPADPSPVGVPPASQAPPATVDASENGAYSGGAGGLGSEASPPTPGPWEPLPVPHRRPESPPADGPDDEATFGTAEADLPDRLAPAAPLDGPSALSDLGGATERSETSTEESSSSTEAADGVAVSVDPEAAGPAPTPASLALVPIDRRLQVVPPKVLSGASMEAEVPAPPDSPTDTQDEVVPDPGSPLVTPPPTEAAPSGVRPPTRSGGVELLLGTSLMVSLSPFLNSTAAGLHGVCLVRESPERVRAQVGARPVEVYALSNVGTERMVRPGDLPGVVSFLAREVTEAHVAVIFLEGVEYLSRLHGVEPVLDQLRELDRLAEESEVRVWVHLTPDLMRPSDFDRVRAAFPFHESSPFPA